MCGIYTEEEMGKDLAEASPDDNVEPKKVSWAAGAQQPTDEEAGDTSNWGYRLSFGKYRGKSLEEIGVSGVIGYIAYLEREAEKAGKPLSGKALEFVNIGSQFVAAFENGAPETDVPY